MLLSKKLIFDRPHLILQPAKRLLGAGKAQQ